MNLAKTLTVASALFCLHNAAALAAEPCFPGTAENPLEPEMVFMSSGGSTMAIFDEVFWSKFEEKCGVKVKSYELANRSLAQMETLINSGDVPFDMFSTFNGQRYPQLIEAGLLEKLPDGIWDGMEGKIIDGAYSDYGVWATPYSTLMIYSTEAFPDGLHSWADFWDVKKYPGPRILQDSPTNIVFALLSTGMKTDEIYPITKEKVKLAFDRLNELRPNLRNFWKTGDQPIQGVASGEFVAGTAWNGRATVGQKEGLPIGISWNGNLLATSWFVVAKNSKHPRAAAAAIRFLQDPEIQAGLARKIGYAGPVKGLEKFLDAKTYANLPSNADNAAVASVQDGAWWAENEDWLTAAWSKWVATGVYEE